MNCEEHNVSEITAVVDSPFIIFGGIIFSIVCLYFSRRAINELKAIKLAEWLVKNQHEPVSEELMELWLNAHEAGGQKELFLDHLAKIKMHVGHANLKIGHLALIGHLIDSKKERDLDNIPKFDTKSKSA